eukprot:15647589-Heterocapsa_arctica.AAC.1
MQCGSSTLMLAPSKRTTSPSSPLCQASRRPSACSGRGRNSVLSFRCAPCLELRLMDRRVELKPERGEFEQLA